MKGSLLRRRIPPLPPPFLALAVFALLAAANAYAYAALPDDDDCDDDMGPRPRIVGGHAARTADFPWFVQGYGCGGTLVWKDVVLTAAHCSTAFDLGQVLVGAVRNKRQTAASEWVRIASPLRAHPDFNWTAATSDFMMFSISPVTNSRLLRRLERSGIVLNGDAESPRDGQDLTVAGFGYTQEGGGGDEPRRLLQANVTSVPASDCGASYPGAFDASVMLCAGRPDGSADTCDGDSGGPAVLAAAAEGPYNGTSAGSLLVGVTSWGIGCGRPEHPGVYARVSSGLPWIRETLCSLSSDPPAYCAK